jgi:signal transduction histidine kinase
MSIILVTLFTAAGLSLGIGIFVLLHSPKRSINHAFFTLSIGIALWIGEYALLIATQNDNSLGLLNAGGLILVIGLTRFAQVFPRPLSLPIRPVLFWSPLIVGGVAMLLTNTVVTEVGFLPTGEMVVTHGPLISLWSILLLSYIIISLFLFIKRYRHATSEDRERLWFMYVGISLFVLTSIIFDAILPGFCGYVHLNQLGPLASLIFVSATAYAILKHRFLDIRVVVQRSLVYSFSFFVLAASYVTLLLFAEHFTEDMIGITAPVSAGITILIGMYTLPYMEAYFRKITDPYFFKDRYDYFSVLELLSEVLNSNLNLRPLALQSIEVLERTFKPQYSYFIRTETSTCYSHADCVHAKTGSEQDSLGIRVLICSGSRKIGEYVLGPKRSGDPYNQIDRSLLKTFSGYATVAFEKAELFQKLRDHTDNLEEKVDERTKDLREAQERQREFFDDISHALQTPLTVLRSGIELLKNPSHTQDTKTYTRLDTSIENLSGLIRSILQLARVDAYSPETEMTVFDIQDAVARVIEYVRIVADTYHISFSSNLLEEPLFIEGNEKQIEEVCTNLLSNAVKYTANSPTKTIHVSLTRLSNIVTLTIKDSGIGMTADQLAKVFERFYRAQQSEKQKEGYGLGLAITKRIIERHKGSIQFQSMSNKGTTVTVTLPVGVPATSRA